MRFIHEGLRVGQVLSASEPRNDFPLAEDTAETIFFAGGIGITPIWCMVQRLTALGRNWRLYYAVRSRRRAAFLDPIIALGPARFHLHADDEQEGRVFDLAPIVGKATPEVQRSGVQIYCCGPLPMLAAFEAASGSWLRSAGVETAWRWRLFPVPPLLPTRLCLAARGPL